MKASIRFKLLKLFVVIIFAILLLLPFLANSNIKFNLEYDIKNLSQETYPEILSFSSDKCLSIDDSIYPHHVGVSMAISDDGIIFVGWKNSNSHNGGGARVSFVRSLDGGEIWTYPYDMPMFEEHSTRQTHPWLYWYDDTIYYAYVEHEEILPEGEYLTQITVAKSDNNGETWTPVKATNGNYFANKETFIVGENNTIYVVYGDSDMETGNTTVRVSYSINGGLSYQEIKSLGADIDFIGPYVTLNSTEDIFIAWTWAPESGGNLYFTKSSNDGQNFDPPKLINQDGNYCMFEEIDDEPSKITLPVLEFDQHGRLYVVWADKFDQQGDTWDVYLRYSDDFGTTWSNRIRINPSITGHQWNPDIAIDRSGRLHIVYYSEEEGRYKPYYRTLNFTGSYRNIPVFSEEIAIARSFTSSIFTRPGEYFTIQLDSNNIPHIAWSEGRNYNMDIYYSHGLTYLINDSNPNELITVIVIILIFGIISVVMIFYIRHKHIEHRSIETKPKILDKELDDMTKNYMKTFKYICSNCHKFSHTLREYCESCGAKNTLKFASKEDYRNYLLDLK
ncbi:MAG: sialidase family protein [Candidatus Hodarchaeota archaeon]